MQVSEPTRDQLFGEVDGGDRRLSTCSPSYFPGMDCVCAARSEGECPGVDWTSSEVRDLRARLKEAQESLAFRRDLYRRQRKLMLEIMEERDELREKYAIHHAEAERLTLEISTAKCTLANWIEWARMRGHLEHAAGIADDSRRLISCGQPPTPRSALLRITN